MVQPYCNRFHQIRVVHHPLYQSREGYTETPTAEIAKERIPYDLLKFQVYLMKDGELSYHSTSQMKKGNWGFFMESVEAASMLVDTDQLSTSTAVICRSGRRMRSRQLLSLIHI